MNRTIKEPTLTETKTAKPAKPASAAAKPRPSLTLREGSTFKDLADRLKVRPRDLLDKLEARGYHLGTNELLDDAPEGLGAEPLVGDDHGLCATVGDTRTAPLSRRQNSFFVTW